MNERQKRFAEHFAACGNAAEAARLAGYSHKTARSMGQRLLTNVDIQNYVRQLQDVAADQRIASVLEAKQFVTAVLRDEREKTNFRIKAAHMIMKSSGAFLGVEPEPADPGGDTIDEGDEVSIVLPWDGRVIPRAVECSDGTIKPLIDAGQDVLVFVTKQQINFMNSVFSTDEAARKEQIQDED